MNNPIPLPHRPVEPDIAATPVAVQTDPATVIHSVDNSVSLVDVMWAMPPNTLVFRSQMQTEPAVGSDHKRRLTMPEAIPACAYYQKTTDEAKRLIPFGVVIDSTSSAKEARQWPLERGKVAVSVSGTVTLVAHPSDVKALRQFDRLCVAMNDDHPAGLVEHPELKLPRIVRFGPAEEARLRDIESERPDTTGDELRAWAMKHRAADSFGIAVELGHSEIRVLLTP